MRKCQSCGSQLTDDAVFCSSCGTAIDTSAEQQRKISDEVGRQKPQESTRGLEKSFLRRFFEKEEEPFDFSTYKYRGIDLDDVYDSLQLARRAEQNGRAEIPASEDKHLDAPQVDVETYIKELVAQINGATHLRLISLDETVESAGAESPAIDASVTKYQANLEQHCSTAVQDIAQAADAAQTAFGDLSEFRTENNLNRDADYSSRLTFAALASVAVLLEAFFNARFFSQSNPQGLYGGFGIALAFAFVDIGWITIIGCLTRLANSIRSKERRVGYGAFVVAALWAFAWNLFVSHYREAATHVTENFGVLAWKSFHESPLGLVQAESWVLFCLGFLFTASGLWAGSRLDDPYPRYGKFHRKLREDISILKEEYSNSLESIDDLKQEAISQIDGDVAAAFNSARSVASAIQEKEKVIRAVNIFIDLCEQWQKSLLQRYRDDNRRNRRTPCPAYYTDFPKLERFPHRGAQTDKRKLQTVEKVAAVASQKKKGASLRLEDITATRRSNLAEYGKSLLGQLPVLDPSDNDEAQKH